MGDRFIEERGVLSKRVDSGRRLFPIAVASQVIGTQRIDRDENDVRRRRRRAAGNDSDGNREHLDAIYRRC